MPPKQKLIVALMAIGLLVFIVEVVRRRKLREEYAWLWILVGVVVPVLLGYMFVQTAWAYATDGYGYARDFEAVFGWGMLFLCAVASAVLTLIPWRTPVDDFVPVDLEPLEEVK